MSIRPATARDFPDVVRLLNDGGLPADDLDEESLGLFLVLDETGSVKGAVGLEQYADIALLRSLVVTTELRGGGYGQSLVSAAEELAAKLGVASVYLLTTSADDFFRARGYRSIHRDETPSAIKGTTQFSALCPSTAVLMVKP